MASVRQEDLGETSGAEGGEAQQRIAKNILKEEVASHLQCNFLIESLEGYITHIGGIDTLTKYLVVSESFANRHPKGWLTRDQKVMMVAANGAPCRRLGTYELKWRFKEDRPIEKAVCHVVQDCPIDIVLGNNWGNNRIDKISLKEQVMTLNPFKDEKGVSHEGYNVPITTRSKEKLLPMNMQVIQDRRNQDIDMESGIEKGIVEVKSRTYTTIPAYSQAWIEVYRADKQAFADSQLIRQHPVIFESTGLTCLQGIAKAGTMAKINVANLSSIPVKVLPGMRVAVLEIAQPTLMDIDPEVLKQAGLTSQDSSTESILAAVLEHAEKDQEATIDELIEWYVDVSHLSNEDAPKVRELLQRHNDLFTFRRLGHVKGFGEMEMHMEDETPCVSRMYRMAPNEREWLALEIKRLLDMGIIEPSQSPYVSPVILIKKPSGSFRLCIDYRKVNAKTIGEQYPLPRTYGGYVQCTRR